MDGTFSTREVTGTNIVVVEGEVDLYTAPLLRRRVDQIVESGRRDLVLDLRPVTFIDTAGLGALVGCQETTTRHAVSLELVCDQPRLRKILRITGLDRVFTVHAELERAAVVQWLQPGLPLMAG